MPEPLTRREARRAVRWFQSKMGLQDWTIQIDLSDEPPRWHLPDDERACGAYDALPEHKVAWVWVSNAKALHTPPGGRPSNPLMVLLHECTHVALLDAGIDGHNEPSGEFQVTRIAQMITTLYHLTAKARR